MIDNAKNFAKVQLVTGYDSTDTTIEVINGDAPKLPTLPFNATWWNNTLYGDPSDDPSGEIVRLVDNTGNFFAIERAQEGTSATDKKDSTGIYKLIAGLTAKVINTDIPDFVLSTNVGVRTLEQISGDIDMSGNGNIVVYRDGQRIIVSGSGLGQDIVNETGELLDEKVDLLSGHSDAEDADLQTQIHNTGELLCEKVDLLSGDVVSNTTDITNLESATGILQTQIDGNDVDIANLIDATGILQTQIDGNDTDIANNASNLAATGEQVNNAVFDSSGELQSQISSNDTDIATNAANIAATGETNCNRIFDASGELQSQITSNDSDISELQSKTGNYYTNDNPSGFQTIEDLLELNVGVETLNSLSGDVDLVGTGDIKVLTDGQKIIVSGSGLATIEDLLSLNAGVTTLNSLSGDVTLLEEGIVTLIQSGQNIIISGGSTVGAGVDTINDISGIIAISGDTDGDIVVFNDGQRIIISGSGIAESIADLESATGILQAQIDSNDLEIDDLQDATGILRTDLDTEVTDLQNQITNNTNDIDVIEVNTGIIRDELFDASGELQTQINTNATNIAATGETNCNRIFDSSGHLQSQIDSLEGGGVDTVNGLLDNIVISGDEDGCIVVYEDSQRIIISGSGIKEDLAATGEAVNNAVFDASGNLQTQITNNDSDIANLNSATGILQAQIDSNDLEIGDLQNATGVLRADIDSNDLELANLDDATGILQTQIDSNDTDIATNTTNIAATGETNCNRIFDSSGHLQDQIDTLSAGSVSSINGLTAAVVISGDTDGDIVVYEDGQRIIVSGSGIANLHSATGILQSQIDSNDLELANLDDATGILQTQIDSNDLELANLDDATGILQTQIDSNDTDIANNTSNIAATGEAVNNAVFDASGHLQTQIDAVEGSDVDSVNGLTANIVISGDTDGCIKVFEDGQRIIISGSGIKEDIANLESATGILQSQIDSNDLELANLDDATGILQTQIDGNDTDIATNAADIVNLQSATGILQAQIDSNDLEIDDLQDATGILRADIDSNDIDIATNATNIAATGETNCNRIFDASGHLQDQIDSLDANGVDSVNSLVADIVISGDTDGCIKVFEDGQRIIISGSGIKEDIANLESATGILQSQIDSNDLELANLDDATGILQTQIDGNDTDIAANAADIVNLQSATGILQAQVDSNDLEIDDLQDATGILRADIDSNDVDIATNATNIAATGETNCNRIFDASGHLQAQIDAVEGSDVDSVNGLTANIVISGDTDGCIKVFEDGQRIIVSGSGIKESLADLEDATGILQTQIDSNDVELANLDDATGILQTQIDGNDTDIATNAADIVNLQSATGILQAQVDSNDLEIDDLQDATGILRADIDSNDIDIANNATNIAATGETNCNRVFDASGHLQTQIDALDAGGVDSVNGLLDNIVLSGDTDGCIKVFEDGQRIIISGSGLKESIADLEDATGILQTQIDSNDLELANLDDATGILQTQIDGNDTDIANNASDIVNLQSATGILQAQIDTNDLEIDDLQDATGILRADIDSNDIEIAANATNIAATGETNCNRIFDASGHLQAQIDAVEGSDVDSVNGLTANIVLSGDTDGCIKVFEDGQRIIISGSGLKESIADLEDATGILQTQIDSNDLELANLDDATGILQTQIDGNDVDIAANATNIAATGQTNTNGVFDSSGHLQSQIDALSAGGVTTVNGLSDNIVLSGDTDGCIKVFEDGQRIIISGSGLKEDIADLVDATGILQAQIDSNDLELANLDDATGILQTQIDSNDVDIANIIDATGILQTQIDSNDLEIDDLQDASGILRADIDSNDVELDELRDATGIIRDELFDLSGEVAASVSTRVGVFRTFWVSAGAMTPRQSGSPSIETHEYTFGGLTQDRLLFGSGQQQAAYFDISMPDEWNSGDMKAKVHWDVGGTGVGGSGVVWSIAVGQFADAGDLSSSFLGQSADIIDISTADQTNAITSGSSAFSPSGDIGKDDRLVFMIKRTPENANDDLATSAALLGVKIQYQESDNEPDIW